MKVAVRADSSANMGTGHVMRCLAIAEALRARGAEVLFLCLELEGDVRSMIVSAGFAVETLAASANDSLIEKEDAARSMAAIARVLGRADWVIVDHYAIAAQWEREVRGSTAHVFAIDDLADRRHDVDLLLDQNFHLCAQARYEKWVPERCRVLAGPRYALLRPQFATARSRVAPREGPVRNIVVSSGGTDAGGLTLRVIDALAAIELGAIQVDVLLGAVAGNVEHIRRRAEQFGFHCHQNASVPDVFAVADLAIGAGGVTTWERACLGVPSIIVALAPNQEPGATAFGAAGYGLYVGGIEGLTADQLRASIATLIASDTLRHFFSKRSMELVDGRGVERVVREMMPTPVLLRLADEHDSRDVHRWRNAETVRNASFDQAEIPWEVHERWFRETLRSSSRVLLIAENGGDQIGVLRYDVHAAEAVVSIYLTGSGAGNGYGSAILRAGAEWLRVNRPTVDTVLAEVREENHSSHYAFLNAGFQPCQRTFKLKIDTEQSALRVAK
jgi:UDP-2,4-diacetamido-2,4,6-trideoxy-beta-L-altropyranose hydrolase